MHTDFTHNTLVCTHTHTIHTHTHYTYAHTLHSIYTNTHHIHYPCTQTHPHTIYITHTHRHTCAHMHTRALHYTTHKLFTFLLITINCSHQFGLGQMTREAVDEHVRRQLHGHLTYFLPGGGSAIGCNDRNHFTEKHIHRLDLDIAIHDTLSPGGQLAHLWFC